MIKITDILKELYSFGDKEEPPYSRFDTARENNITEIGDTTARPYKTTKSSQTGNYYAMDSYSFATDSGTQYKIYVEKTGTTYAVSFKALSTGEPKNDFYREVNDPKNVYRVMATVVSAIKQSMESDKEAGKQVTAIEIEPTKRQIADPENPKDTIDDPTDKRREKMYLAYVKQNLPAGYEVENYGGIIRVYLPRNNRQ